jgi:hypothetical protein
MPHSAVIVSMKEKLEKNKHDLAAATPQPGAGSKHGQISSPSH